MALTTIRVLDGADRGRVFENVPTPLTIGREEGNSIQLNDERISRCHLKIQDDENQLVLTDLGSTNGTKVNGETIQVWTIRPGDVVALGRTLLLFGSREEIARRLAQLRAADLSEGITLEVDDNEEDEPLDWLESELDLSDDSDAQAVLHTLLPPELPGSLSLGQTAQLAELIHYLHLRIRGLILSVQAKGDSQQVTLQQHQWQNLLDLQSRLATYLRSIGEPTD
jgi:pSer/pThr/pTyr-binding forkhead associated (FHA) protein